MGGMKTDDIDWFAFAWRASVTISLCGLGAVCYSAELLTTRPTEEHMPVTDIDVIHETLLDSRLEDIAENLTRIAEALERIAPTAAKEWPKEEPKGVVK